MLVFHGFFVVKWNYKKNWRLMDGFKTIRN